MIRRTGDAGSVTAEFAVVLPAIVVTLALGAAALAACGRQVRLQDAAADAARLVARGEPLARAQQAVASAVAGATISVGNRDDLVCVTAAAPARLPVPMPPLQAVSCALAGGV